jgi:hypothetical protein
VCYYRGQSFPETGFQEHTHQGGHDAKSFGVGESPSLPYPTTSGRSVGNEPTGWAGFVGCTDQTERSKESFFFFFYFKVARAPAVWLPCRPRGSPLRVRAWVPEALDWTGNLFFCQTNESATHLYAPDDGTRFEFGASPLVGKVTESRAWTMPSTGGLSTLLCLYVIGPSRELS